MAVELAQAGCVTPLNDAERQMVVAIAKNSEEIFGFFRFKVRGLGFLTVLS